MQHHPISSPTRSAALATCAAALALVLAGPAAAKPPQILTERAGNQPTPALPQVVDPPSDRVAANVHGPAPIGTASPASNASDDSDNAPLIVGLSLATVALLGSGTFVARRRRHVAPGH